MVIWQGWERQDDYSNIVPRLFFPKKQDEYSYFVPMDFLIGGCDSFTLLLVSTGEKAEFFYCECEWLPGNGYGWGPGDQMVP